MLDFIVSEELCTRCGECVAECPAQIIGLKKDGLPYIAGEKESACYQCQHCLAVCPTAAVSILGKRPEDSVSLTSDSFPTSEQMNRLVRGRRSVRRYRSENVDPDLLRELLQTLANVPTGVNKRDLTFSVIGDSEIMREFKETVLHALEEAAEKNLLPEQAPLFRVAPSAYFDGGKDIIFRGAPHLLIASAPSDGPCGYEDVILSLAYFELLAQSAGIGTVWAGLVKWTLHLLPGLKTRIGLPEDHVFYAMLFGLPAVGFPRTVQRDDQAVIRDITI